MADEYFFFSSRFLLGRDSATGAGTGQIVMLRGAFFFEVILDGGWIAFWICAYGNIPRVAGSSSSSLRNVYTFGLLYIVRRVDSATGTLWSLFFPTLPPFLVKAISWE